MKIKNLSEEEKIVVNASRNLAGFSDLEDKKNDEENQNLSEEETLEKKSKLNEDEERRIRQKGGLRPNELFSYYLLDWDKKIQKITIKYPGTKKALSYGRLSLDSETSKAEILFNDTVLMFEKDGLIPKFDMDNFPSVEVQELSIFLSRVINNPYLK